MHPFLYFVTITAMLAEFFNLAQRCGCTARIERGSEVVMYVIGHEYVSYDREAHEQAHEVRP